MGLVLDPIRITGVKEDLTHSPEFSIEVFVAKVMIRTNDSIRYYDMKFQSLNPKMWTEGPFSAKFSFGATLV